MIFDKFKRSNDSGFAPRPKVQGNWKCADCGTTITELPFEPSDGKPVHCKDCWKKNTNCNMLNQNYSNKNHKTCSY